jgi:manganese transport protein
MTRRSDADPDATGADGGWRYAVAADSPSLADIHASVAVPAAGGGWLRRFFAFAGPGYLVSVGYMDPGNWATDIAGGARFGYTLLSIVLISNMMAVFLQALAARLGIATGRDLAQACRDSYSRPVVLGLWLACEIAIVACDLAEVVGTALALELLFGIPLIAGAVVAALDAVLLLYLMRRGFRTLEALVVALLAIIAVCFAIQIVVAGPSIGAIVQGFVPSPRILRDPAMLYIAISIVGATVMPHNLYLHSALVQSRAYDRDERGRREAIGWAIADSTIALSLALFVNAAILVVAAVAFHDTGHVEVEDISQAYRLLSPLLGLGLASAVFAAALLASGLNSTITATLAGQIVMEGFLRLRLPGWARRLVTRGLAVIPVIAVVALFGEAATGRLLVLSQVVLAMQLPFAVFPLVRFVSDRKKMGPFALSRPAAAAAWAIATVILALNVKLLFDVFAM